MRTPNAPRVQRGPKSWTDYRVITRLDCMNELLPEIKMYIIYKWHDSNISGHYGC